MARFACFFLLCIFPHACSQEEVDVAIIGAGYSGLAAALQLQKAGVSFRVFEARDRVGGRTLNLNVGKTNNTDDVIELGGEWLAPEHHTARTLFADLGFDVFKRAFNLVDSAASAEYPTPPCAGNCSIRVKTTMGGWKQASVQDEVIYLLSKEARDAVDRTEKALYDAAIQVPCTAPLSHPSAAYYDSLSFEAYLREVQKLKGDTLRDAYNWMTGFADDADSIRQVSTLAVLWERNCTKGMLGGPYEDLYRVRGGTQGPAKALFSKMQAHITLKARVEEVVLDESTGKHAVSTSNGNVLAKHVIVAGLPPSLVLGIHFHPPLQSEVAQWLQRYPLGTSMKYHLVYKTPWWRAAGFLGKILIYNTTSSANKSNLFTAECLDNSPYSWSKGVIMCFVEGPQNRAFMKLSESERKSAILSVIDEAFGNLHQSDEIEQVVEHNWADDEYSRGAYSTFPMPGVMTNFWNVLSNIYNTRQLGPRGLWIAGADYSTVGLGYIDGALSSGMQAAEKIIKELNGVSLLV